jgi:exosortase
VKYSPTTSEADSVQSDPELKSPVFDSQKASANIARGSGSPFAFDLQRWSPYLLLSLLLVVLYYKIAGKLVYDWLNIEDFSHGPLVPFFSLFLLWDKRAEIRATPVSPSWKGLPLLLAGICVLIFGVYGADLFLSRTSFLLILASLVWIFAGRAMLGVIKFPLLVLLLAIPIPDIIFNQLTFPLQLLATELASAILPVFNVPVLHDGNIIQLPVMKLEVAEACSGIRSLMSLFTLSVFYGYFLEKSPARRVILALASIPIAVAANALRIVGTGLCVQFWDPDKALGFFHEFSGWVVFCVSLCMLYIVHRVMLLVAPVKHDAVSASSAGTGAL